MVEEDGWRIDFDEARDIRLFELEQPDFEHAWLTYRARMRTENAQGARLSRDVVRLPGQG